MMGCVSIDGTSAADEIDSIIEKAAGWRAATFTTLRRVITTADPDIVEEIKWRKPSRPEGVATWVCDGNVCVADVLKNAVRLTFPKGARIDDPDHIFNTRLDSATVRAIDYFEGSHIDDAALRRLILRSVALNRTG
jgi:hypothetical protein